MDLKEVTTLQLREGITQQQVRTMQIITLAMMAGVVVMIGVVFYFMQNTYVDPVNFVQERQQATRLLIYIVILIAAMQYMMAAFIVRGMLTKQRLRGMIDRPSIFHLQSTPPDPVTVLMNIYRQLLIIRLAIFEGVALMGLVVFLFCGMNGTIKLYPLCWLALVPSVVLFLFAYIFYPTKDKVIFWIDNNLLPKIRGME